MADNTGIEWTDTTWNPLAGCTPASEGCRHCFAAAMALRLEAMGQAKYAGTAKRASDGRAVFTGRINLDINAVTIPLRWKKPRRIFVNSMSDLFHPDVPDEFIHRVYTVMEAAEHHTYQVLTKRPERMAEYTRRRYQDYQMRPHIWHGTTVENQEQADKRIPHLLRVPAAVRFLSCEPLLGPVNLDHYLIDDWTRIGDDVHYHEHPALHWIIAGGESGPKARPMHPDWARSLRDQAQAAGVAFFMKQMGTVYAGKGHGADCIPDDLMVKEFPYA